METGVPRLGVVGAMRALVDHPLEAPELAVEWTIPEQPDKRAITPMARGVAMRHQRFATLKPPFEDLYIPPRRSPASRFAARAARAIAVRVGFFSELVVKVLASTTATLATSNSRLHGLVTPKQRLRCIRAVPP
jgi:hypothetical protein